MSTITEQYDRDGNLIWKAPSPDDTGSDNTPSQPSYRGPTWTQITSSPSWQKFSADQRATVRQRFYDTYVAPNFGDDEDHDALRKQFDQLTAPSMAPQRQVGIGDYALRGFVQGGGSLLRTLQNVGDAFTGQGLSKQIAEMQMTPAQRTAFREQLYPGYTFAKSADEYAAPQADEEKPNLAGRVVQGASRLLPEIAGVVGSGGESAVPEALTMAARSVPYAGRVLGGIVEGLPTATKFTGVQASDLPDDMSPLDKAAATAKAFGLNAAMAGLPAALGTSRLARIPTGAALGGGQSAVVSALSGQPQDAASNIIGALQGAAFGAAPLAHGHALDDSAPVTPDTVQAGTGAPRAPTDSAIATGDDLFGDGNVTSRIAARNARDFSATAPLANDASAPQTPHDGLASLPPLSPADRAAANNAMRRRVLDELAKIHGLDDDQRSMLDGQVDQAPDVQPDATHGAFDSAHLNDTLDAARTHAGAIDEPFHLATVNVPAATPKAVRKIVETVSDALGEHADEIVPHYGDGKVSFVIRGADTDTIAGTLDTVRELARRSSGRNIKTSLEPIDGTPSADAVNARADSPASVDAHQTEDANTRPDVLPEDVAARDMSDAPNDRVSVDDTRPGQVQAAAVVPHVDDVLQAADRAIANRRADGALHDFLVNVAPMAAGTPESRAIAKDYANEIRLARHEGNQADAQLVKNFTPEQHAAMWRAADEESVLRQRGENTAGRGLDRLDPTARAAVESLQAEANKAFEEAKAVGIISPDAKPLPSYVPRMLVSVDSGVAKFFRGKGRADTPAGGKIRTNSPNAKGRKYLTADETQAAAQGHDDNAQLVENIRTLPLAISRLRSAIAGRRLVNQIRAVGEKYGEQTVVEGRDPSKADQRYFTIPDEPALSTYRTRTDEHGNTVTERVPLYIRGDFEGPLRAVLGGKQGAVYNGLMQLKQKTMGLVMYSPIIHNMVEFGRALPAMPGKVASFKVYFEGNAAKNDPATMREAIKAGLAPIGHGARTDITGIANEPNLEPGRSWTAKLLAAVPGMFDKGAGTAVKRWVDKAGDVWHNTLLWDRIADLQMGLYVNFRDSLLKKGLDPRAAQISAAHLANRYAGALPKEAMSEAARKTANLVLFSRTFTLGNLGALKDTLTGLPKDAQAQILRDSGELQRKTAVSIARRKAIATVAVDIGLGLAMNSVLQSAIAIMRGDSTLDKEQRGYVHRLNQALQMVKENPLDLFKAVEHVSATSTNEPGKHDRVLVGHTADGTAVYMRNPVGKIGEEFTGWMTKPLETLKAKLSTFAKPVYQTISNDVGFGRKLYDDKDTTPGAASRTIGRIVANFIGQQLPLSALQGAKDWYTGNGDATLNAAKVLAPLAGMTFSKGAPGGEAVGEMYAARARHDFQVQDAMPGIREQIRRGDLKGAYARMLQLGMAPGLAQWEIRATLQPSTRLSKTQMGNFARYATPDERARMAAALQRQQGAQ